MGLLMGIDLGTSSVKALLMDEAGRVLGVSSAEYPILIPSRAPRSRILTPGGRPRRWPFGKPSTKSGEPAARIKGIGFSGQMHGMVPLDSAGDVVRPAIIWCDQRSRPQVDWIYEAVGKSRMDRIVLNPLYPGFLLTSLAWMRDQEPTLYRRLASVLLPKDYLRYRLTGTIGTEESDASSTLAFDVSQRRWAPELIQDLGFDPACFPPCARSTDVVGTVGAAASADTGLVVGTPVIAGGSDQPMQAVGNGLVAPGSISVTIGTGGQIYSVSDQAVYNPRLNTHTFCNVVPDRWYVMAATLSAGLSLSWFRESVLREKSFETLSSEAAEIPPGSEGLLFLPYLAGERTPHLDPDARAVFFGLTLKHNRAHMARAVMEGVALSMRDCYDVLCALGVRVDRIIGSGGGARSALWMQILADVLGRPIHTTQTSEQASFGAAVVAGVGVGVYPSIPEACSQLVRLNPRVTEPIDRNVRLYEERYRTFKALFESTRGLFALCASAGTDGGRPRTRPGRRS